ncbi:hypothetical protein EMPS_04453 [Entomortierella parvispora]|uniref:J domain-containing protein n=1 Tax=Entomortierella parvispora TaxID=205924 RepID=A0A9P3H8I0_9FUNG|nr:hypothetical protein EMPS_04453 [Entomortierella parvispora]
MDDEQPNYYQLLNVEPNATKDEIRKAYRRQALLFHPDKMKPHMKEEASQHFQLISEAYDVLFDDKKRELYDRYGPAGVKAGGNPNPEPEPDFFRAPARPPGFDFGFPSPFPAMPAMPAHFYGGLSGFHGASPAPSSSFSSAFDSNEDILRNIFTGEQAFSNPPYPHMPPFGHMGSMFADDIFRSHFEQPQQQRRPTLFSTSPFSSRQTMSQNWTGAGTSSSPFTDFGSTGGFTSTSSSSSFGGRRGVSSSTRTNIVNGQRTTITEVTDEQGVTTKTIENPDGTKQVFVNGQPAAIEGNRQQPIYIDDDDSQTPGGGGGGGRVGGGGGHPSRSIGRQNSASGYRTDYDTRQSPASSYARGVQPTSEQNRRTTTAEPDVIVLDEDEDENMYEDFSRDTQGERESARRQYFVVDDQDDDPNLFHPRMGRGQTLRGRSPH